MSNDNISISTINLSKTASDNSITEKRMNELKKARSDAMGMGGFEKRASLAGNGLAQPPYSSPYLSLSDYHIPEDMHELFDLFKYYYIFDPLISGAINALANFPVTEIYLEDIKNNSQDYKSGEKATKSKELQLYEKILFRTLKIYKLLVEIGIDYYLYGNCFIFGKMIEDPATGRKEWESMTRLDPTKMIIDFDPVTQKKVYKWYVPESTMTIIKQKRPKEMYDDIPDTVKKAVEKHGAIVLSPENIYHFARPSDSKGSNSVWGVSVVANVIKNIAYRNKLRRAQEAIAEEHIVPFRVYYLQSTQENNVNADWNNVANSFAGELMKTVHDPNHKVVSPVPVGLINVGGDGRALLLTAEIEQIQNEILAGMNVPREFIFGGVSYSGSSVSLKILENQFATYRLLIEDFVQNFVIKKMAIARGDWNGEDDNDSLISAKFNQLKTQDDVQQKQLYMNLNSAGKLPDALVYEVLGLDSDRVKEQLQKEALDKIENDAKIQLKAEEANFKIQRLQVFNEIRLDAYRQKVIALFFGPTPPTEQQVAEAEQDPEEAELMQQQLQGQFPEEGEQEPEIEEGGNLVNDPYVIASNILKLPPSIQLQYLEKLEEPTRGHVSQAIDELKRTRASGVDMRPMPEQLPPRRNSLT